MNIVDYKRLHGAMEIPNQETGSPLRESLEKMLDEIVRLERQRSSGVN